MSLKKSNLFCSQLIEDTSDDNTDDNINWSNEDDDKQLDDGDKKSEDDDKTEDNDKYVDDENVKALKKELLKDNTKTMIQSNYNVDDTIYDADDEIIPANSLFITDISSYNYNYNIDSGSPVKKKRPCDHVKEEEEMSDIEEIKLEVIADKKNNKSVKITINLIPDADDENTDIIKMEFSISKETFLKIAKDLK